MHFSYPTRPEQRVLDAFNLTAEPGQTVALCGASGSGKSTVIALLERFYDPDPLDEACKTTSTGVAGGGGVVELDGHDIRTLNLQFLRGCMSLVSQEPRLFAGSVAENISCERLHCICRFCMPLCIASFLSLFESIASDADRRGVHAVFWMTWRHVHIRR